MPIDPPNGHVIKVDVTLNAVKQACAPTSLPQKEPPLAQTADLRARTYNRVAAGATAGRAGLPAARLRPFRRGRISAQTRALAGSRAGASRGPARARTRHCAPELAPRRLARR